MSTTRLHHHDPSPSVFKPDHLVYSTSDDARVMCACADVLYVDLVRVVGGWRHCCKGFLPLSSYTPPPMWRFTAQPFVGYLAWHFLIDTDD